MKKTMPCRGGIFIYKFTLPYGTYEIGLALPAAAQVDWLSYQNPSPATDARRIILDALDAPVGSPRLRQLAVGKKNAAIVISDSTRLAPSSLFLPELIAELQQAGMQDDQIKIIVALGAHRQLSKEELSLLTGERIFHKIGVFNHSSDSRDCVYLGTTSRGTPVEINRLVAESELLILTGNIEPHRLAGMSGGVKALVPGVASLRCIEHNHGLSMSEKARIGDTDNAVHEDLTESLKFMPVDFMLNVIAGHDKNIISAVSGSVTEAHRHAVELAKSLFISRKEVSYDLVIASAGGHPKDMQLYQSVKSLENAAAAAKPGSPIFFAAQCGEGFGNPLFEQWVESFSLKQAVDELQKKFRLGPHKILQLYNIVSSNPVYFYSELPEHSVNRCLLHYVQNPRETLLELASEQAPRIAVMPHAALTFLE